jgi:hypothetical protein
VPGSRRSARHWLIGIYAAIFSLWAAIDSSVFGWGVAIVGIGAVFVVSFVFRRFIPNWIARKVDPLKGMAPGDRVGPITRHPSEVTGPPPSKPPAA